MAKDYCIEAPPKIYNLKESGHELSTKYRLGEKVRIIDPMYKDNHGWTTGDIFYYGTSVLDWQDWQLESAEKEWDD